MIASREQRVKVSLRSRLMIAKLALVDPELTYDLPPAVTAATGMDALTQSLEAYVSRKANPLTDGLALEGVRRSARSLRRAAENGHDISARGDMAVAALLGGMVLANAGLGAVHGIVGPLGGMLDAPHGALCAALLPEVVSLNIRALRCRMPGSEALARYQRLAVMLTGRSGSEAEACGGWLRTLVRDLDIPRLGHLGLEPGDIPELVVKASRANSMKGNPIPLDADELTEIIQAAL